jgi:hypothetical protein
MTHDFADSLAYSHAQADAPYWLPVYRKAFPTLRACVDVRADGWHQRAGVDRVLTLRDSTIIRVDEKVRCEDWPDIALEVWSDEQRQIPGWACKDALCDYIAYAFEPSRTCYLLPFLLLRRSLELNKHEWWPAGRAGRDGFRLVRAQNRSWTTLSLAVPIAVLLGAIRDAMVITWTVEEAA